MRWKRSIPYIFFSTIYFIYFSLASLGNDPSVYQEKTINFRMEKLYRSIAIFIFSWNKTPIMRRFVSRRDLENDTHESPMPPQGGGRLYRTRWRVYLDSIWESESALVTERRVHDGEMRVNAHFVSNSSRILIHRRRTWLYNVMGIDSIETPRGMRARRNISMKRVS